MRRKRTGRWILRGVVTLLLVSVVAFALLHRTPYLLETATRLPPSEQELAHGYIWLTSHEIFCSNTRPARSFVLDIRTGHKQVWNNTLRTEWSHRLTPAAAAAYSDDAIFHAFWNPVSLPNLPPADRLRTQSIQAHVPADGAIAGFATSPDGKQIACLVVFLRLTPLEFILSHLWSFGKTHPHRVLALYYGDRDGEHIQEVARQPDLVAALMDVRLGWVPDGKHVSFVYNGALWMVPLK